MQIVVPTGTNHSRDGWVQAAEKSRGNGLWPEGTGKVPGRKAKVGWPKAPGAWPGTCTLRGVYLSLALASPGSCIFASDPLGWVTRVPQTPHVPASGYQPCYPPHFQLP